MTKTTENPSNRFWASIKHRCAHEGTLIGLILVAGYLGLALFGYSAHDPGFTYAGHNSDVRNIMGPSGAWIANVLISAALSSKGIPAKLVRYCLENGALVFSSPTFDELRTRLY